MHRKPLGNRSPHCSSTLSLLLTLRETLVVGARAQQSLQPLFAELVASACTPCANIDIFFLQCSNSSALGPVLQGQFDAPLQVQPRAWGLPAPLACPEPGSSSQPSYQAGQQDAAMILPGQMGQMERTSKRQICLNHPLHTPSQLLPTCPHPTISDFK